MNFSKIKINLPAIAFVMAVGAAFAFNSAEKTADDVYTKYTQVPISMEYPNGWREVSGIDYQCQLDPQEICTAEFSNPPTSPTSTPDGAVESGVFVESL